MCYCSHSGAKVIYHKDVSVGMYIAAVKCVYNIKHNVRSKNVYYIYRIIVWKWSGKTRTNTVFRRGGVSDKLCGNIKIYYNLISRNKPSP